MTSPVWVAPREIRDIVNRCCRVRRLDAGVSADIGSRVMADHVAGGSGLTQFVDALRRDELDVHFVIEAGPMRPIDAAANPYRDGIEVSSEIWTELHSSSAAFLVSAELLDSFED